MYLEKGALNVSPLLSSRAILTLLTRKYKDAAELICGVDRNQEQELTADEILMLVKIPSYRLLLEKSYDKLIRKPVPDDPFFERLLNLGIDRQSLLNVSSDPTYDLIVPPPFNTSLIDPSANSNLESHNSLSQSCEIYETFPMFSRTSSVWSISKPTDVDIVGLVLALRDLGKIAVEPIEDIALNVRYIATVESRQQKQEDSLGASFSIQVLPGIIFLGGYVLKNPPLLIESLYHESLHIKWINTYHAYDLLRFQITHDVKKFVCPWAKTDVDREWPFVRAIAAYHVYCHLLALHRLIICKQGPYDEWSSERIPTIREKLLILEKYIHESKKSGVLTDLGKEYFNLLSQIGEM